MTNVNVPRQPSHAARFDNSAFSIAALERARGYANASHSANTRRSYQSDWRSFSSFCLEHGLSPLPAEPQTVAVYLTHLAESAGAKASTLRRRLAAICIYHKEAGHESPTTHEVVRRVLRGICRVHGSAQTQKAPIALNELRAIIVAINRDDLKGHRDRAILLLGFSAALRRSEIVALDVNDIAFSEHGLRLTIRRSKTDPLGSGVDIAVPYTHRPGLCAASAVRKWLEVSGLTNGPLFRSFSLDRTMNETRLHPNRVAEIIKALSLKAGLQGDYAGHSLRAGFVTAAARAGVSLDRIARVTRHRSFSMLTRYIRRADLFEDPALSTIVA